MSLNIERLFYPPLDPVALELHQSQSRKTNVKNKVLVFYNKYSPPVKSFYLRNKLACKLVIFILYYTIGVAVMSTNEHWSVIESAYFLMVTTTTVGYGFYHPTDNQAKWFVIFYSIFGVTVILNLMVTFATTVVHSACDELILQFQKWRGLGVPSEKLMSRYRSVFTLILTLIAMLVGTLVYSGLEGWDTLDGLYFTVITMTTVGYGDLTITREVSRVFGIIFLFCSVILLSLAFNNMVSDYIANEQRGQLRRAMQSLATDKFGERWLNKLLVPSSSSLRKPDSEYNTLNRSQLQSSVDSMTSLNTLGIVNIGGSADVGMGGGNTVNNINSKSNSSSSSNGCSKERFVLHVLAELGVLNYQRDILPLFKKFSELDQRQVGALNHEDLQVFRRDIEALSRGAAVQGEELGYRVHNPLFSVNNGMNNEKEEDLLAMKQQEPHRQQQMSFSRSKEEI